MVMHLPPPDQCSVALVDTLVQERSGGRNAVYFNNLAAEWRRRVSQYVAERGNPEVVPSWPAIMPNKKRFLTLYNAPAQRSAQHLVLRRLRERKLQSCPSCGEEGTPNTLDHYLPKELFPHFAVTPANLTPMCDICQMEKGEQTVDARGFRLYLHPYFDDFAARQVLRLKIGRPLDAPADFRLEADGNLPDALVKRVNRHIEGLAVQRRYGRFFRAEYVRLLRLAQDARESGTDIRGDIPKFKRLHELRGPNVWPHLFYSAVVEDAELLAYLAEGLLPERL